VARVNHAEQQIRKLAIELYEKALADGAEFALPDLLAQLIEDLIARFADDEHSAIRDLIEISARAAVDYVDRQRTKPSEQPTLGDDLDAAIAVGDSARRVRRRMDMTDWAKHLGYIGDNAARVNARAAKENRRYAALAAYLGAGMDTEAALAAWQGDHPDEVLP
jgi:hypothetical protein